MGVSSGFPGWFFGDSQGDSWGLLEAFPEWSLREGVSSFPWGSSGSSQGVLWDPWGSLATAFGPSEAFSEGEVGVPRRVFRVTLGELQSCHSEVVSSALNRQHAIYCLPRRALSSKGAVAFVGTFLSRALSALATGGRSPQVSGGRGRLGRVGLREEGPNEP